MAILGTLSWALVKLYHLAQNYPPASDIVIIIAMVIVTSCFQTWKAANTNPVDHLKNEINGGMMGTHVNQYKFLFLTRISLFKMNTDLILKNVAKHIVLNEKERPFFISLLEPGSLKRKKLYLKEGTVCKYAVFVNDGALKSFTIDQAPLFSEVG